MTNPVARVVIHAASLADRVALGTCYVAVITMTGLVLLQVVLRYLFGVPLIWVEEATILMMIWMTFMGAAVGIRRGAHVAATSFIDMLPNRGSAFMRRLSFVFMLAFVCTTFWYGTKLASATINQSTIALGIPRALTYGMIPLGSLLIALQCLASLLGARHADATSEMAV